MPAAPVFFLCRARVHSRFRRDKNLISGAGLVEKMNRVTYGTTIGDASEFMVK